MMLKMSQRRTHGKQVIGQVDAEKGKMTRAWLCTC